VENANAHFLRLIIADTPAEPTAGTPFRHCLGVLAHPDCKMLQQEQQNLCCERQLFHVKQNEK